MRTIRRGLRLAAFSCTIAAAAAAQAPSVGLSSVRAQRFDNDFSPTLGPQDEDEFGRSFAVGDFDGDGAADLATGVPGDDGEIGAEVFDAGLVLVRYGVVGAGLGPRLQLLRQVGGGLEAGDFHGFALAACDFDGDGFDDLAISAPEENLGDIVDTGAVFVHSGAPSGLSTAFGLFTQDTVGIPDAAEIGDYFGFALACGDFDDDGFGDLAIGVVGESIGGVVAAGAVAGLMGAAGGLDPARSFQFARSLSGAGPFDGLGSSLAIGDFDGDGFDDLAAGAPGDDGARGGLEVRFGVPGGLNLANGLSLDETEISGAAEAGDRFGEALATGDFDDDGRDDLAIGIPREDLGAGGSILEAGQVAVLPGDPGGFDLDGTRFLTQNTVLGAGASQSDEFFGAALSAGDFDRDGPDDLAVGAPGEFVSGTGDGLAVVIMGSPAGLDASRHRGFAAGVDGIPGDPTQHERRFAAALARGDFDGDGYADLAIGAPNEDLDPHLDVGAATVLYGALFADGFETADADLWSGAIP